MTVLSDSGRAVRTGKQRTVRGDVTALLVVGDRQEDTSCYLQRIVDPALAFRVEPTALWVWTRDSTCVSTPKQHPAQERASVQT